jgi:anti-sigma factor RsiW
MTTCDDIQVSLEMTKRGVTAPVAQDVVGSHLASCPACAAYAATMKETEQMTSAFSLIDAQIVYDRVQQEMSPPSWPRRIVTSLVALAALLGLHYVLYLDDGRDALFKAIAATVTATFAVGIGSALYSRQRKRMWQALANASRGEVIAARRAEVRELHRISKFSLIFLPVISIASLLDGISTATDVVVTIGMVALIANSIVHWRRTRNELRELA